MWTLSRPRGGGELLHTDEHWAGKGSPALLTATATYGGLPTSREIIDSVPRLTNHGQCRQTQRPSSHTETQTAALPKWSQWACWYISVGIDSRNLLSMCRQPKPSQAKTWDVKDSGFTISLHYCRICVRLLLLTLPSRLLDRCSALVFSAK